MKKLAIAAFAAASMSAAAPAHANGNAVDNIGGIWYGGSGCQNRIPILNRWFPTLGCTRSR